MSLNRTAANFGESGVALDKDGAYVRKAKVVRITAADVSASENAGFDFDIPAGSIVHDVFVNVITAEATATTKTLDIGTATADSGDPDGFLDGISVAAAGVVRGSLISTGQTKGALLREDEGTTVYVPCPYVNNTTAKALAVTGSAGFADLVADIIIEYTEVNNDDV